MPVDREFLKREKCTLPMALTPRARKVLSYAEDEARTLNHEYVGTEHLLLGLLQEQEGAARVALESLGNDVPDVLRSKLLELCPADEPPADDEDRTVSIGDIGKIDAILSRLRKRDTRGAVESLMRLRHSLLTRALGRETGCGDC